MRRFVLTSFVFCCLLGHAAAGPVPQTAPAVAHAAGSTGFVPPPVDLDHVVLAEPPLARDLPARFDWREHGQVSPVRNQGACGSCYAFAAAGELEARVLRDHGVVVDLSENHIKSCHFEARGCEGGNAQMVMNLLTRTGAVAEACDPYLAYNAPCQHGCAPQFAVRDWIWLTGSALPAAGALKQALLDHGPLSTTMYAGDGANPAWQTTFNNWNGGTGLYHAGNETPNHAVLLVGWDDDWPHAGGGNGCWIIKNSWGTGWGDACGHGASGGYFYLAYGSAGGGKWTSAITEIMTAYPELAVTGWDAGGWTGSIGYNNPVAWGLMRVPVTETTHLHCVEFWTTDTTLQVDVAVHAGFTGGSLTGLLAGTTSAGFGGVGYHSVELPEPLALIEGNTYYVSVRLQNASYGYPLAIDGQGPRSNGNTWISLNGSSWVDLAGYSAIAGMRVRTSPHTVLPIGEHDDAPPPAPPTSTFALEPPWPNPFNPATTLAFHLDRAGPVRLRILDLRGRLVHTLVDGHLPAGRHEMRWLGRAQAAGVYIARLDDGSRARSQRLVLLK